MPYICVQCCGFRIGCYHSLFSFLGFFPEITQVRCDLTLILLRWTIDNLDANQVEKCPHFSNQSSNCQITSLCFSDIAQAMRIPGVLNSECFLMVFWKLNQNELDLESDIFIQKTFIECLLHTSTCAFVKRIKRRLWKVTYRLREEKCTINCKLTKNNISTYKSLSLY